MARLYLGDQDAAASYRGSGHGVLVIKGSIDFVLAIRCLYDSDDPEGWADPTKVKLNDGERAVRGMFSCYEFST
jgi:hypothetical protein